MFTRFTLEQIAVAWITTQRRMVEEQRLGSPPAHEQGYGVSDDTIVIRPCDVVLDGRADGSIVGLGSMGRPVAERHRQALNQPGRVSKTVIPPPATGADAMQDSGPSQNYKHYQGRSHS